MTKSHRVNLMGTLKPKEECVARLHEVLVELAERVKEHEEGCLSYLVWESKEKDGNVAFILVETWASDEAFANHHNQPHLIKAVAIIENEALLTEPEEDRFLEFSGGWNSR